LGFGEAIRPEGHLVGTIFGFVSTYPPTQCGLATFTASLRTAVVSARGDEGWVARLVEDDDYSSPDEVVTHIVQGDAASMRAAVGHLNQCDVAIVQHEYGIYGGVDGDEIVQLLDDLEVPSIVVLHTVLTHPTEHQRVVLEDVAARADAVVTMTATARDRLAAGYDVDMRKVCVIAHGAPDLVSPVPSITSDKTRFTVLTWGLLGPGKGLEWGIEAMSQLQDLDPLPGYLIAGQTHPKVLLHEGETYRDRLRAQVRTLDLDESVTFDDAYRDAPALAQLIRAADVVLLPYDSTEQVTSGVLIEAVAAGKPVVATRFPHAVELLGDGAGMLVAHRDPQAIADALRTIITCADVAAGMASAAAAAAPELRWSAIADRYRALASQVISASVAA
jgi:polysaccharide biosynthesis protein PslF